MSNLQYRQSIIQEKRKSTPWRKFVIEICSWFPIVFYKNQSFISRYPETVRSPKLISHKTFSENRNDISIQVLQGWSFFTAFSNLFQSVSLSPTIQQLAWENTDFADSVVWSSNSYLSAAVINDCRNILYSHIVFDYCRDVVGSLWVSSYSENVYNSVCVVKSVNIFYSRWILNSNNIYYSSNLIWCNECILCDNLINQSYSFKNIQYSKEEFLQIKKDFLLKIHSFQLIKALWAPENFSSIDVQWTYIYESSKVENGYFTNRLHNSRNVFGVWWIDKEVNFYDVFDWWVWSYDMYANEWTWSLSNNVYCSSQVEQSSQIFYSYYLINCSFCLGCIGLKNKSYCILNKQYTKEERYSEIDKIFWQMHADGNLWDFFPASMNPFYFNDTAAYLIDPSFTKEEVTAAWYLRRDEPIKVDIPADAKVVKWNELDKFEERRYSEWSGAEWRIQEQWNLDPSLRSGWQSSERYIDPEILKYVIQDEQGNYYRIIPMEYKFLMKHALPLPRKHRLERMKENFRIS
jgi:hypothetical protein